MRRTAFRHSIAVGAVLVAIAAAAPAQEPSWAIFDGEGKGDFKPLQAAVQGTDGMQLILKCDKPGNGSTYAIVVAKEVLAPAGAARYENRPVNMRFDDSTTVKENWRFFDKFASAVDDPSQKVMSRFIKRLANTTKLEMSFERFRQSPVQGFFPVLGARDVIDKVYASCKDKPPA